MSNIQQLRLGVGKLSKCVALSILLIAVVLSVFQTENVVATQEKEKVLVPILNQKMTRNEMVQKMKAEGAITIANWTYGGMATKYFGPGFKRYMKEKYGLNIEVHWLGTQTPGTFMTQVFASLKADTPPPYDVMAIETPFFFKARAKDIAQPFIHEGKNPLIPIYPELHDFYKKYAPYGLVFQAIDTAGLNINTEKAPFVEDYTDLADPRLKGHLLVPTIGTAHFTNFLLNLSLAMGKDYKDPEEMKEVIEFAATNIHPNVLKYTTSEATMIELLEREVAWVNAWWFYLGNVESMKGYPITWKPQPQGNAFEPGVAWIPNDVSHPLLAQAFMDYLVSPERTLALYWPEVRENKSDFMMVHQMLPNETYFDKLPEWLKPNYDKYLPWPMEKMEEWYTFIDWGYVIEHMDKWSKLYRQKI